MNLRLFLVLLPLIFSDSSLGAEWLLHTEKDEMEGTSETYPFYRHQSTHLMAEIHFKCSSSVSDGPEPSVAGNMSITVSTHSGTMPLTTVDRQSWKTYAPIRIDWGDGDIENYAFARSEYFANRFTLGGLFWEALDVIDPKNFKLELVATNGETHIVRSNATFSQYVNACVANHAKNEAEVQRLKNEKERQRREEERKQREAGPSPNARAAYMFAVSQKISRNWARPASANVETKCVVNIEQNSEGEVVAVSIGACNGGEAVQRSIEAAILRASPLPLPDDPRLFEPIMQINLLLLRDY